MKFRKKPVVIEAEQLTAAVAFDCLSNKKPGPFGVGVYGSYNPDGTLYTGYAIIKTLEGDMRADLDDWIIKGVKNELYPCKPQIFEMTYEPVEFHDNTPPSCAPAAPTNAA